MRYIRTAMRKSKHRKPPSLYLHTSTRDTSPRCSSVLSDWDADDEGFMSSGEFLPSRPLSLTIPAGPYCPRRPTLQEVLSNNAPPPWTLSAFMAYLSQNHCLETLEFTMDASRYTKHYHSMVDSDPHTPLSPNTQGCEYVRMLWTKLLDAYIAPNGPREVNLPSDVRDRLMSLPCTYTPPHPSALETAVKIIYELMDESVLVPFLNSVVSARGPETYTLSNDYEMDTYMTGSLDESSLSPARSRNRKDKSPVIGSDEESGSKSHMRFSHHPHLSAAISRGSSRLSTHLSGSGSSVTTPEATDSMTDDSTNSAASPSGSDMEPMTPPTTPPTSDTGFTGISPSTSPRNSRIEGSGWKKMGAKLGWKKSRAGGHHASSSTSGSHSHHSREPSNETQ